METAKEIKFRLKEFDTFICTESNKIIGLLTFTFKKDGNIDIVFICSMVLRKKIGTKLMHRLAKYTIANKINNIYSNVSSKDKRVMNFYDHCGFKRVGKYFDTGLLLYKVKAKPADIINNLTL